MVQIGDQLYLTLTLFLTLTLTLPDLNLSIFPSIPCLVSTYNYSRKMLLRLLSKQQTNIITFNRHLPEVMVIRGVANILLRGHQGRSGDGNPTAESSGRVPVGSGGFAAEAGDTC